MNMNIEIKDISAIQTVAKTFIQQVGDNKVFAFRGAMGAGKTTFIKAICEELGVKETVSSPTFAIINEYRAENENAIYHFDFYRIKKIEEALDFGVEEYLYSGNFCFIEWAEKIETLLPENIVNVYIRETENGNRIVSTDY
jgi:tRNA threonylcarbamoyladenosine biosynthesis protein TsaE